MADLTQLRGHLFAALEGVANLSDPNASEADMTSLEQAKTICSISKEIVETYKVEVQAMAILAKAENPNRVEQLVQANGLLQLNKNND